MDLYGIGFSNVRMSNSSNDYTYIYDTRINIFPEEVYVHEFLHTLERNLIDYGYEIPALHDNEKYGYKKDNGNLAGLRDWYEDYMKCNILDKTNNKKVGLNEIVYRIKPAHKSNFQYPIEIEFNDEPTNVFEDIKSMIHVIADAV